MAHFQLNRTHRAYGFGSNQLRVNAMSLVVINSGSRTVRSQRKAPIQDALTALVTAYFGWRERRQQRLLLQRLDDRMLKDIGLSRSDVDTGMF